MFLLSIIKKYKLVFGICFIFFIAYSILGVIRHNHYGSFGYDLGIDDQIVWKFSRLKAPITTIDDTPYTLSFTNHFELIFTLLSPIYWIWNDVRMLIVIQAFFISFSAIPVYLLTQKYKLLPLLRYTLLIGYLSFYGIQHALWFDVHSAVFGTGFIMWFIYLLDVKNTKWACIVLLLALTSKENIALMALLISLVFFIRTKQKYYLFFSLASLAYLVFIFGIYFPYFVKGGYHYQDEKGLFSNASPTYLIDTDEKRRVIFYSLLSFGFLPVINPLYIIPFLGNLASYFILGRNVTTAQGLFLHYRVEIAPLLVFATIFTIAKFKILNNKYIAYYLLISFLIVQYSLHLPLSYLAKSWFWKQPESVKNINTILTYLPRTASVTTQDNITPHISHRNEIFTLWPVKKRVHSLNICGKQICDMLSWGGNPEYLIVDTSSDWDIRHFLADRSEFRDAVATMEQNGYIQISQKRGNAVLYKIIAKPKDSI